MYAARCSRRRGTSTRHPAGTARSSSCVIAPNAQMRPQYSRPHSTVETTEKMAKRYHARLNLKMGRFHRVRPKMLTIEMSSLR